MRKAVSPFKHHFLVGYAVGAKMGSIIHVQDFGEVTSESFEAINTKIAEKLRVGSHIPDFNVVAISRLGEMDQHAFGSYETWERKESPRYRQC